MRIRKIKWKSGTLLSFSAVLLITLTCFPLGLNLPSIIRYPLQCLAMLCFLGGLIIGKDRNKVVLWGIIVTFMFIRVFAIRRSIEGFFSCAFNVCVDWAFVFLGIYYYRYGEEKQCKRILYFLLFLLTLTAVTTIIGLQKYPLAVREQGRLVSYSGEGGEKFALLKRNYRFNNIATWSQLYGIAFAVPCFVYAFIQSKRRLFLISAILCELCVIRSQITFALLLSLMLTALCVMKPSVKRKYLVIEVILTFWGCIAVFNVKSIILWMSNFTTNRNMTMLSGKLHDLYILFQGTSTGDVSGRVSHYMQSISLFMKHPLLGQLLWGVDSPDIFSNHSDFFDMLGYYGLFGVTLVIIAVVMYCCFIKKTIASKWITYVLFVGFFTLYVFNLVWLSPQVFLGAFMIPSLVTGMLPKSYSLTVVYNNECPKRTYERETL